MEAVKEELKSHLSVLKTAKKKDMKRLTIHTSGAGSGGEIFVAYTVEARAPGCEPGSGAWDGARGV